MTEPKNSTTDVPVVDVDQAFPPMVRPDAVPRSSGTPDASPDVQAAIRNVLGWRPRTEDPKAFISALTSSFQLVKMEGHVESRFVPRGHAVQSDLGAVTGGQASLYRRASIGRTEILRILDALTPLRADADTEDMAAFRSLVRSAVQNLVDELGYPGGPRVQIVDSYFRGLTGTGDPTTLPSPDKIGGQLGQVRERFGFTDANVNTVPEEDIRTSFWTLSDLITDLQKAWVRQKKLFTGTGGGFLGTELILLSRRMEATVDQVDEFESVLESVLIAGSERRTIVLDAAANLTLDGLLSWIRTFLRDEARAIAQDTGRDGIVSSLTPTVLDLVKTYENALMSKIATIGEVWQPHLLPASCIAELPAGMHTARSRIAAAGLCRLLHELRANLLRIARFPLVVLDDVTLSLVDGRNAVKVTIRGANIRQSLVPAFVTDHVRFDSGPDALDGDGLIRPLVGTASTHDDGVSAIFRSPLCTGSASEPLASIEARLTQTPVVVPAEYLPIALIDGETGQIVLAPEPRTYPELNLASKPVLADQDQWDTIPTTGSSTQPIEDPLLPHEPDRTKRASTLKVAEAERAARIGNARNLTSDGRAVIAGLSERPRKDDLETAVHTLGGILEALELHIDWLARKLGLDKDPE